MKEEFFRVVYFPRQQKYTVWIYPENPYTPICLNGHDEENWLETRQEAENLLEEYKTKLNEEAEKLAEWFHDTYEEVSLKNGWKTQADCQVPFIDLPESNKKTMIEVCQRLFNHIGITHFKKLNL